MSQPVLADEDQCPTEAVVFAHIGRSRALWHLLFEHIHRDYPDFTEQWRYYRDGKSWLLKVSRKARTVFWLSVAGGSFCTTFYFTRRADQAILSSSLSEALKEQYRSGRTFGKLRGLTIDYRTRRDVEYARELIAIKIALK